jgi:hypothetical protein
MTRRVPVRCEVIRGELASLDRYDKARPGYYHWLLPFAPSLVSTTGVDNVDFLDMA